ncbi:hypothetical protein [Devosia chinhatensis]|uniref:hypothetical protein n=1 Tax=Devosia chinhatensis TaxID=429727 RepID=UPI000696551A|nr:hypothetical protein [Devosia chinhatensis]
MALKLSFRTRSPDRDQQTNRTRFAAVSAAISTAIADAERERHGLRRRIEEYYSTAVAIMDESGDFADRAAADETAISQAEQRASAGRARLDTVDAQIEMLQGLQRQVEAFLLEDPSTR